MDCTLRHGSHVGSISANYLSLNLGPTWPPFYYLQIPKGLLEPTYSKINIMYAGPKLGYYLWGGGGGIGLLCLTKGRGGP